jgi:hypothetical protein
MLGIKDAVETLSATLHQLIIVVDDDLRNIAESLPLRSVTNVGDTFAHLGFNLGHGLSNVDDARSVLRELHDPSFDAAAPHGQIEAEAMTTLRSSGRARGQDGFQLPKLLLGHATRKIEANTLIIRKCPENILAEVSVLVDGNIDTRHFLLELLLLVLRSMLRLPHDDTVVEEGMPKML